MSEKKKDLKAFLSKQSKKGKKPAAAAADPEKPAEETKVNAEVIQKDQPKEEVKKAADSDEEVDDAEETGMDLGFAKIKELKDIKQDNQQDEIEKKGYGFDDSAKAQSSKAKDSVITRNTTKGTGEITFGGAKPKFGRKKATNAIDGFDEGLDDIDDDGKIKKNKGSKNTSSAKDDGPEISGAAGGREFINFGSKPRDHKDNNKEEVKEEGLGSRAPGVKPTFKRREPREFKNTNNDDEIRPSYDFKVSYKTSHDKEDGEKKERRQRDHKDKGVPLDSFNKKAAGDDDEFTFVTGKQKRGVKKNNSDSEDDDNDGFKMERGGRSGRGGFFKNSKKAD